MNVKKISRILVAIKDPEAKALPALDKAVQLARAFGAKLELFHAITERLSLDAAWFQMNGIADLEGRLIARYQTKLDAIAGRLRGERLAVTATASADFPVYEAVVRRARDFKADLIVAECHAGRRAAPWLLHVTDWELLRTSPVPVLLVKNAKPYRKPVVLAALDPTHAFAKPAKLDQVILQSATRFTEALQGALHAMHSFSPAPIAVGPMNGAGATAALEARKETERRARLEFARVVHGQVARSRRHLVCDIPIAAIPAVARETGASLVVMGAVSRSGLKRLLIGNTAERVLPQLSSDVLVVKPAAFVSHVAKEGRGIRIVATPSVPAYY